MLFQDHNFIRRIHATTSTRTTGPSSFDLSRVPNRLRRKYTHHYLSPSSTHHKENDQSRDERCSSSPTIRKDTYGQGNEHQSGNRTRIRIPVLQYHNDWVCVNKPAGMTMHRSKNTPKHKPVLTTSLKRQLARKVFPIHRLDHRTSGATLFAFDSITAGRLHDCAIRKGRKQYLALLRGSWRVPSEDNDDNNDGNMIDSEQDDYSVPHRQLVSNHENATITILNETSLIVDKSLRVDDVMKAARTKFTLLAEATITTIDNNSDDGSTPSSRATATDTATAISSMAATDAVSCSLVLCELLDSGRTHQIRRHAYALGQPVIGDSQHGDSKVNRFWRTNYGLNRLALHCWNIEWSDDADENYYVENGGDYSRNKDDDDDNYNNNKKIEREEAQRTISCLAPLPKELRDVLGKIPDLWKDALRVEPRLSLESYDMKGGSFGRNYKNKSNENS